MGPPTQVARTRINGEGGNVNYYKGEREHKHESTSIIYLESVRVYVCTNEWMVEVGDWILGRAIAPSLPSFLPFYLLPGLPFFFIKGERVVIMILIFKNLFSVRPGT